MKVLAQRYVSCEWVVRYHDEIFSAARLIIERHYLQHYGKSYFVLASVTLTHGVTPRCILLRKFLWAQESETYTTGWKDLTYRCC